MVEGPLYTIRRKNTFYNRTYYLKGDCKDMQDMMQKELERIFEEIQKLDPKSKEYTDAIKNYHELLNAFHEDCKARDDDLNNELKRKLDKEKQALAEKEAADRLKQAKLDAIIGLAKIGITVSGTLAAIVLTGFMEESTILSAKCLGWIKGIAPRI